MKTDERYQKAENLLQEEMTNIIEILNSTEIKNPQEFLEKCKNTIVTMKNVIIVQGVIILEQQDTLKKFNLEAKQEKIQTLLHLESWEKTLVELDSALQTLKIYNASLEKKKLEINKELKIH